MPPPQPAHVARPVSRIGPVTTRGGVTRGFFARSVACTASNVAASIIGSTSIEIWSASGLASCVFQCVRLNLWSPL